MSPNRRISVRLGAIILLCCLAIQGQPDPEARVLEYLRDHLRPGEPLVVTDLYNNVFTRPEERRALGKLYNAFFRIPLFVAQYQAKFGAPPTLQAIAEQFDLRNREAAGILVRVMESDPRVPRFFTRDAKTGEFTQVDSEKILADPRFGKGTARQLGGWEGQPSPDLELPELAGNGTVRSATLRGKVVLLYVWFTGCPPCLKETPELVALDRDFSQQGLTVIGANADRLLGLEYDDAVRRRYAQEEKIRFSLVQWTKESDSAFGSVTIFPTLFLIDRRGVIARHWVGFVSGDELRRALAKVLETSKSAP